MVWCGPGGGVGGREGGGQCVGEVHMVPQLMVFGGGARLCCARAHRWASWRIVFCVLESGLPLDE